MNAAAPRSITKGSSAVGKPNAIGIGAGRGTDATGRRHVGAAAHAVDADQAGARDHLDVEGHCGRSPRALFTPTTAKPCSFALAIAVCVTRYIATMPLLLPPSNNADTGVSRSALHLPAWLPSIARCSTTFNIFGSPEYS